MKAFLDRGYNVVANSRNITKTNPFSASANLALVDGDISDPNTATKIADTALSRFDRIDALVNNAGIFFSKHFTDYTVEDLRSLMSVNIEGFLFITQLAIKQMLAQNTGGSIVNLTSTMADHPIAEPLKRQFRQFRVAERLIERLFGEIVVQHFGDQHVHPETPG